MRISDWSSDVCSSDLLVFGHVRCVGGKEAAVAPVLPAANEEALDAHCAALARKRENIRVGGSFRVHRLRALDIGQRFQPVTIDGREFEIEIGRGRLHRFAQLSLNGARSEEHTSELQSLMRISYAVFCLKKKNCIV